MYLAFAAGFATGNYVGILLENKIAIGIALIRVITRIEASELIDRLRQDGLTVTGLDAEGNTGPVKVFFTIVKRRKIPHIVKTIKTFNPRAFYTIEDVNYVTQPALADPLRTSHRKELIGFKRK